MLVEFSVGNFRSFKDIQTLSMVAAPIASKNKELDEQNTFQATPKLKLLKTKAIYGANGSGKSNFVNAMMSFLTLTISSLQENTFEVLFNNPFLLNLNSENEPSFFQIIIVLNNIPYRYGFETDKTGIISEWLFITPIQREVNCFKRDRQMLDINDKYLKGAKKIQNLLGQESPIFKNTSLFITILASLNNSVANDFLEYFKSFFIDVALSDRGSLETTKRKISKNSFISGDYLEDTIQLLKFADAGIKTMKIVEASNNEDKEKILVFVSEVYNDENKKVGHLSLPFFDYASEGTKKVFDLNVMIHNSLEYGHPIVIDEFDSKLHPIITKKIVESYNKNENNAQLVFVTHDTNLLDSKLLRRDQIAFVEKDKFGASHLYDLVEFKGVRNDASFEKDYLDGRYGAIPFVGNFDSIFAK